MEPDSQDVVAQEAEEDGTISLAEFLEDYPPNTVCSISGLAHPYRYGATQRWHLTTPDLQLYCSECGGVRTFTAERGDDLEPGQINSVFAKYVCRNCQKSSKTYSLQVAIQDWESGDGQGVKIGEHPRFGPPVPSRTISLVGPDRDLFLKGRSAESHGLGIGAYAYYRRVVDNQWSRFLAEVIRVAKRTGAAPEAVQQLEAAANEAQFSKAVDMVKDAVPEGLKIDGHNPLTLLYGSLSEGVHDLTDEECLELAAAIRAVLYELADRISTLLKDQAELRTALSNLLNRGSTK